MHLPSGCSTGKQEVLKRVSSVDGHLTYSGYWLHRPAVLTGLYAGLAEGAAEKCFSTHCRTGNVFYRAELHSLKTADGQRMCTCGTVAGNTRKCEHFNE